MKEEEKKKEDRVENKKVEVEWKKVRVGVRLL